MGTDAFAQEMLPTFLVVGAMRSGTSSLARYLRDHPDIYVPRDKELHFFDSDDRDLAWYGQQFAGAGERRARGEATPSYMYDPEAFDRLADTLPDARLIAILRDPVERAYSHYWHERERGQETLPFREAIAAEQDRLSSGDRRTRLAYSYVDRGRYATQLERVLERYSEDQLLVLLFDDLRDRPAETFREACRFVGVDDSVVPERVGETVNRFGRTRSTRLRRVAQRLPYPIQAAVSRLNTRRDRYPPMPAPVRAHLAAVFAEPNARLVRLIDRDLSGWSRVGG